MVRQEAKETAKMSDATGITRRGVRSTQQGAPSKRYDLLLERLHKASQALSNARDEAAVRQALMGFSATGDIDVARLLVFEDYADDQPVTLEMREGWSRDKRRLAPYGTELSFSDYSLLELMSADSTLVCEDVDNDIRLDDASRQLLAQSGLGSCAIFPLTAKRRVITGRLSSAKHEQPTKEWLSAMLIGRDAPSAFDDTLMYAWWTLAGQAASVIQSIRLQKETQQRLKELSLLLDSSSALSTSLDLDNALQATAHQISTALSASGCSISRWDRNRDALIVLLDYPIDPDRWESVAPGTPYPLADYPISRRVLNRRQPAIVQANDPKADRAEVPCMAVDNIQSVLMVPLVVRDEVFGLLELLQLDDEREFTPTEIALCQTLANQAAAALENAQLFEQTQRRSIQLQTAAEVSRAAGSILEPDELTQQVVDLVRERFDLYYVGLFLVDKDAEWAVLRAATGNAGRLQIEQGHKLNVDGESMVGWCVANARARIAQDVGKETTRFVNPLLPETRSEMALPLISRGQVIGAMTIQSAQAAAFSEDDISVLQTMADQLANAIQNARLFDQVQAALSAAKEQAHRLTLLNELSQELSRAESLAEILETTTFKAGQILPAEMITVTRLNAEGDSFAILALQGEKGTISLGAEQPLTGSLMEAAVREKRLVSISEAGTVNSGRTCSLMIAPLRAAGHVSGTISVGSGLPNAYTPRDENLLLQIAALLSSAIENRRLFEQIQASAGELSMLFDVSRELSSAILQPYEIAEIVTRRLRELGEIECSISLLDADGDTLRVLADFHLEKDGTIRQEGTDETFRCSEYPATARVLETSQPLVVQARDLEADPAELVYMREQEVETLAIFPLSVKGQAIGVMELESREVYHYPPEQLNLVATLANQAAVALENARLYEESQSRAQRERQLGRIMATINASEDLMTDLDTIAQMICEFTPASVIALVSYRPGDAEFTYVASGEGAQAPSPSARGIRLPLKGSGAGWVISHQKTWIAPDLRHQLRFSEDERMVHDGTVSRLITPLRIGEQVIGTLDLGSPQANAFTEEYVSFVSQVADQMALALERTQLLEETREALAKVQATHQRYLQEQWDGMLRAGSDRAWGYFEGPQGLTTTDSVWTPEMEKSVESGELTIVEEPTDGTAEGNGRAPRSGLAVPIQLLGQTIGVLGFYDEQRVWTEDDKALVEELADQVALALENQRLFEQTQRRAYREHLTAEIGGKIRAAGDVQSILEAAAEALGRALGVSRTHIRLGDPTKGFLYSQGPTHTSALNGADDGGPGDTASQGDIG
jgi:GAF domain-containing protein